MTQDPRYGTVLALPPKGPDVLAAATVGMNVGAAYPHPPWPGAAFLAEPSLR